MSIDMSRSSMDLRRDSLDHRRRSLVDNTGLVRLFGAQRHSVSKRNHVASMYERSAGSPSNDKGCSLCSQTFSYYLWKYTCLQCQRVVCKSCCSKEYNFIKCDPCSKDVDPGHIIVSPGGWSAKFSIDLDRE